MTLVETGDLVHAAASRGGAVAAFNVVTLEHAEAITAAANSCGVPVIMQISQNSLVFHSGQLAPISAACSALAELTAAPVGLHLDHITDENLVAQAAVNGFSSIMVDGSALSYAENVALTWRSCETAQADALWVEAELGYVGGKQDAPQSAHAPGVRTDPDEAAQFVTETGVDALAVAVGSSHAMTSRSAVLDIALIEKLRSRLSIPLVLHGSSGVPDRELQLAIAAGISKVNIGTALNVAMTTAIRQTLTTSSSVDPRPYLAAARNEMTATVHDLLMTIAAVGD